jgi:hypothetical protein
VTGLRSSISPSIPASVFRSCQTNPILLTCWWISATPPSPICALASIFFSGSSRHLVLKMVTKAGMPDGTAGGIPGRARRERDPRAHHHAKPMWGY